MTGQRSAAIAQAFVVADAHGRHDLIEGLLRQEGLLEDHAGVTVIQIGDLCNCVASSVDADLECLRRAPDWFDVYLVGNHEHPYFGGPAFGGYWRDPEVANLLLRYNKRGLIRPAVAVDGVLISHAGLTSRWGRRFASADEAEAWLTTEWEGNPHSAVFSAIGRERGGWDQSGGVLWADWREPKPRRFNQLVGHTVGPKVRWRRYGGRFSVCIDLGASKEVDGALAGAWIRDGKVEVVTYAAGPVAP